jgi:hypothetical protein
LHGVLEFLDFISSANKQQPTKQKHREETRMPLSLEPWSSWADCEQFSLNLLSCSHLCTQEGATLKSDMSTRVALAGAVGGSDGVSFGLGVLSPYVFCFLQRQLRGAPGSSGRKAPAHLPWTGITRKKQALVLQHEVLMLFIFTNTGGTY